MDFEEVAQRDAVWLRGFFMGPTGSGKSEGALRLAAEIARIFGGDAPLPVVLINTEKGRGKLYADRFKFGYIGLDEEDDYAPEKYEQALDVAERNAPGGVYVIDSVSHEWMGKNGILQQADKFGEWKTVRPKHNGFVDRILDVQGHVIVTCRAKMKYGVDEEEVPGRTKPRQVVTMLGVGPIQSDDFQYEFNLVGRFDQATHEVSFSGHAEPLVDTVADLREDVEAVAAKLCTWLSDGNPIEPPPTAHPKDVEALLTLLNEEGIDAAKIEEKLSVARKLNRGQLSPEYVAEQTSKALERKKAKAKDTAPAAEAKPEPAGVA